MCAGTYSGWCSPRATMAGAKHSLFCILDTESTKREKNNTHKQQLNIGYCLRMDFRIVYVYRCIFIWAWHPKRQKLNKNSSNEWKIRLKYFGWSSAWCTIHSTIEMESNIPSERRVGTGHTQLNYDRTHVGNTHKWTNGIQTQAAKQRAVENRLEATMLDYECLVNFAVFPCEVRFIRLVAAHKPILSYTLEPLCIPLATISHSDSLYE